MKPRSHDPRRLAVAAFAAEGGVLSGHWPLDGMPRVLASEMGPEGDADLPPGAEARPADVDWSVTGELRATSGGAPETWLTLSAQAIVRLQCQRCLGAVDVPIDVSRRFRFVSDETAAERLDEEIEDEVLVLGRSLDLHELVEDELLLAMPLVPRHDVCPDAPPLAFGDEETEEDAADERKNPFAVLAALKKGAGGPDGAPGA